MKHVHAELMMQYAQDAMETDKPWERWEWKSKGVSRTWVEARTNLAWQNDFHYRRKPSGKTIVIDGEEFIVPKSDLLKKEENSFYYIDTQVNHVLLMAENSDDRKFINSLIFSGNCYKTEAEAKQALKFWKKINEVTE